MDREGTIVKVSDQGSIEADDLGEATHTYVPSVAVNNNRVVAFGFGASSPDLFVGAYATFRDDMSDPPGTVQRTVVVKEGENIFRGSLLFSSSAISNDPIDDRCFWTFHTFSSRTCDEEFPPEIREFCWDTVWTRLCVLEPNTLMSMSMSMTSKSGSSKGSKSKSRSRKLEDVWTHHPENTKFATEVDPTDEFKEWMQVLQPEETKQPKKFLRD